MSFFSRFFSGDSIDAACGCSIGKVRKNNEDNFYFGGDILGGDDAGTPEILTDSFVQNDGEITGAMFAVFDGMGGGQHGEIASYDAADCTAQFFADQDNFNPWDVTPTLTDLCMRINRRVVDEGRELGSSLTGTTMAALYFYNNMVWSCNLGDSRCYRIRGGSLERLSVDHVSAPPAPAKGKGKRKRRGKPGLVQYLGMDPDEKRPEPHIVCSDVEEEDVYLICSDGLTDMVTDSDIAEIIGNSETPEGAVKALIDTALDNGGKDNITVIVCAC